MHDSDLFTNQLLIQIRRRIHQQVSARQTKNGTRSSSLVSRMIALACITAATDRGYSDRSSCAQQNQLSANVSCDGLFAHWESYGGRSRIHQNSINAKKSKRPSDSHEFHKTPEQLRIVAVLLRSGTVVA